MIQIKGVTVTLIDRIKVNEDPFGEPVYIDKEIKVENVLISPTSTEDIVDNLEIEGKKAVYTLAIPKGDTNVWEDREVRFFGQRWKVFGKPLQGIEELVPLKWNKKVMVEAYE